MKKFLFIRIPLGVCVIATMVFSIPLLAQTTTPDITGVTEVHLNLACNVSLIQGDKASLIISGDTDELENVHAKVSGGRLEIHNDKHHQHKADVIITITLPDLKEFSVGGAADVTTPNPVNFEDLKVEVSGVADIDIKLKSKKLELDASGVISGEITGETKDFKIEISGVGNIDASEFKSENCDVEVTGVAKASVYATEKLDASVSGMGRINYQGRPIINKSSSGFGSISRL